MKFHGSNDTTLRVALSQHNLFNFLPAFCPLHITINGGRARTPRWQIEVGLGRGGVPAGMEAFCCEVSRADIRARAPRTRGIPRPPFSKSTTETTQTN